MSILDVALATQDAAQQVISFNYVTRGDSTKLRVRYVDWRGTSKGDKPARTIDLTRTLAAKIQRVALVNETQLADALVQIGCTPLNIPEVGEFTTLQGGDFDGFSLTREEDYEAS